MVAIAKSIIAQRIEKFDPSTYRDRYQEALRELIEAKVKGLPIMVLNLHMEESAHFDLLISFIGSGAF